MNTEPYENHDSTRRWKLTKRIEGMLEWMDYQEINLTFWDELKILLEDLKRELE